MGIYLFDNHIVYNDTDVCVMAAAGDALPVLQINVTMAVHPGHTTSYNINTNNFQD